jgi:putative ABC transport system permease protein
MQACDLLRFAAQALLAHRLRSLLTLIGIAVGIAAVVLLTAIGEGIHRFVLAEFTQFGTNLIKVIPGKTQTFGISSAVISNIRPLSLDDAEALESLAPILAAIPLVHGNAAVETRSRSRRALVFGVGPEVPTVWSMAVGLGRFLPRDSLRAPRAYAVLGAKVRQELFPLGSPLGQRIRIGGDRYRIIGVMEPKGQFLGLDLDDAVYIPANNALALFDRDSLMEIDVLYPPVRSLEEVVGSTKRLLMARHGAEDFSLITQQQMLDVLGSIFDMLTFIIGALGGISLLVGGVGIATIMTISVAERTAEIGLLRALGAQRGEVKALFLLEASLLAMAGGLAGLGLGVGMAGMLALLVEALPVHISWSYALLAELLAGAIGLLAGVLPARRASGLSPLDALQAE